MGKWGFGDYFRTLRKQRGLSQLQLGQRAGLSVRTLAYWESGEREPRVDELNQAFNTMGVEHDERTQALALLRSVRGIQMASQEASSELHNEQLGPLPNLGDLLRALRIRNGCNRDQLAKKLGLNLSTVVRWEAMQTIPTEANLERLCTVLNALPEEKLVLKNHLLFPETGPLLRLDLAKEHTQLYEQSVSCRSYPLADLDAIVLKRQLRMLTPQTPEALRLLARVETAHSYWLTYQNRIQEAGTQAKRALAIVHPQFAQELFWHMALNISSLALYEHSTRHHITALRYLRRWTHFLSDPALLAYVHMDMATYAALAGHHYAAQQFLHQAHLLFSNHRTEEVLDYYRTTQARILAEGGFADKAIALLLPLPASGNRRIFRSYLVVQALYKAGARRDANHYLEQLLQDVANHPCPGLQSRIDTLARNITQAGVA